MGLQYACESRVFIIRCACACAGAGGGGVCLSGEVIDYGMSTVKGMYERGLMYVLVCTRGGHLWVCGWRTESLPPPLNLAISFTLIQTVPKLILHDMHISLSLPNCTLVKAACSACASTQGDGEGRVGLGFVICG